MKDTLKKLLSTIETVVIRRDMRRAILRSFYARATTPMGRNDISLAAFRTLEDDIASELGVRPERKLTDLQRVLEERFGITREAFDAFPSSDLRLPLDADLAFDAWIGSTDSMCEHHRDTFDDKGVRLEPATTVIDGRAVPQSFGLIVSYKDAIHYVLFLRYKEDRGAWQWYIKSEGPSASEMLAAFQQEYDAFAISRLRGKVVTQGRKVIELKAYQRDTLVYPRELGRQIDELLGAFKRWADPTSKVCRWGSLLVGRPGTGKTTIGGLLGAHRPADCTFVYFPAADVEYPQQITDAFALARKLQPCVLQIDDVDLIARDRRSGGNIAFTSALMEALDGLEESAKLFVILTSNDVSKMEPAIVDRAGRISSKLVFTGFGDVCGEMIASHAAAFGLSIARDDLDTVVLGLTEKLQEFTPDEAKNICQRLYLTYGEGPVSKDALASAILETAATFHSETANESFLPQPKSNGRSREVTDDYD